MDCQQSTQKAPLKYRFAISLFTEIVLLGSAKSLAVWRGWSGRGGWGAGGGGQMPGFFTVYRQHKAFRRDFHPSLRLLDSVFRTKC